ncbi:hypothetical protein FQB35_04995 [Crassaminicella thermophila]|uniref:Uncharacterized protein n=1 Tax=Crassaminicella thermophila TaxID=2599308 RepID=A0A5C0SEQ1_CRATE|nr:hypothetical protein [Crassaminicella thermophila]QEK11774.1 hypothetical protein FQB35_04995 [Crassaminicella thermophila]
MGKLNKKKLEAFMKSMGDIAPTDEQKKMIEQMSTKYGDKNEEEIIKELKKLKASMIKNTKKYKKQMQALEQMKDFLDEEQKKKLEKIMKFLNEEEKK